MRDLMLERERRRANIWMLTALASLVITLVVTHIATHTARIATDCLTTAQQQRAAIEQQRDAIQQYDRMLREQLDTSREVIGHLERCQRRGRVYDAGL